jgi:Ca2+-binding EF-hand superfamily protein
MLKLLPQRLSAIFNVMDIDGDGRISRDEVSRCKLHGHCDDVNDDNS